MNDQQIESEIQAKGLTAPRVTPADIEDNIKAEIFFTALDGAIEAAGDARSHHNRVKGDADVADVQQALSLLTFCVIVLKNGFTVTGESACASPENFDADLGRKIARANAVNKIWPLLGFALKQRLHEESEG